MMILYNNLPKIDLHGMDREYASFKVREFINDNYNMGNENILIIHGIGTGILRKTIHEMLKKEKKVKSFYLDFFNIGSTVVTLNKKS